MKELKVGERITVTLEAENSNDCECCFFNRKDICRANDFDFECNAIYRSDGKDVIFKEVKK